MSVAAFDVELDVRQLECPLPMLRAKKSLATMQSGQVLKIVATDKKSPADFAAFCKQTGNELLSSEANGEEFVFFLRRRESLNPSQPPLVRGGDKHNR